MHKSDCAYRSPQVRVALKQPGRVRNDLTDCLNRTESPAVSICNTGLRTGSTNRWTATKSDEPLNLLGPKRWRGNNWLVHGSYSPGTAVEWIWMAGQCKAKAPSSAKGSKIQMRALGPESLNTDLERKPESNRGPPQFATRSSLPPTHSTQKDLQWLPPYAPVRSLRGTPDISFTTCSRFANREWTTTFFWARHSRRLHSLPRSTRSSRS